MKKIILFLILGILSLYTAIACVTPTINMSISSNTTFCAGDYDVYGITIDADDVTLDFESNTRLFFPNSTIEECVSAPCQQIITSYSNDVTINCNGGLIYGWYNGNDEEGSYNGTFGIGINDDGEKSERNHITKCEIVNNLHPIANWVDEVSYALFDYNNIHDNYWQFRGGGHNSTIRFNNITNLLAIGRNMLIEDNNLEGLELGYTPPEGDLECLTEDGKFSGIARRNIIGANRLVVGCRYPDGRMNITLNSVDELIVFGRNALVTQNNISSVDTWWSEINDSEFIGNKFTGNTRIRGKDNIIRGNDFGGTGIFECQNGWDIFNDCVNIVFDDNHNIDTIGIAGTNINITNSDTDRIFFYGINYLVDNVTATTGFPDNTESLIKDLVFKNSDFGVFSVQAGMSDVLFTDSDIGTLTMPRVNNSVVTRINFKGVSIGGDGTRNNQFFNNIAVDFGGCSFTQEFNVTGNYFYDDGLIPLEGSTCTLNAGYSLSYFYNNTLFELIDNTNFDDEDDGHVDYCVKKDGEFMGNYIRNKGFVETFPLFGGSCDPIGLNYFPSIVLANETNLCFDFSLDYDDDNIIGMYNTDTSTNYIVETFNNTGDDVVWHQNYSTCLNLADAGLTDGNYYFYMGIPDSPYGGSLFPYPFVVGVCTPNWSCNGYATCIVNEQACNSVEDLNTCGEIYSGDYSEFTPQSCSPITGYTPAHVSSDIASVVVDFFVEFWIQIIAFIGLIALVLLGMWLMAVL